MNSRHVEVANIILEQIGGRRFAVMTGAKDFVAFGSEAGVLPGLKFRLPGKPGFVKDGITHVAITLTPADEYRVEFFRVRGLAVRTVKEFDGVYCDMLRDIFERTTGLRTSL